MSAVDRSFDSLGMFSDYLRAVVHRRLRELGGLLLLGLVAGGALALATWSVNDPSLSHATSAPVRNMVGVPGAIAADLLMQLLGLSAVALLLPVAVWGWRLMVHRPLTRELLRILFWLMAAAMAAGFASCLPRTATWA